MPFCPLVTVLEVALECDLPSLQPKALANMVKNFELLPSKRTYSGASFIYPKNGHFIKAEKHENIGRCGIEIACHFSLAILKPIITYYIYTWRYYGLNSLQPIHRVVATYLGFIQINHPILAIYTSSFHEINRFFLMNFEGRWIFKNIDFEEI